MESMVQGNTDDCLSVVQSARQTALKLENDKRKLEDELKEWLSILEKNNIDMNEALVDAEEYPRADIDVYQVRLARHKISYIKNDLREIMKNIEKCLHVIHSKTNLSVQTSMDDAEIMQDSGVPIARVISITNGSPSNEAGLKVGDLITKFGSVNSSNFNSMSDIHNIVKHSTNQFIKLVVRRNEMPVRIDLKPHPWSGQGMLGCVVIPYENVER